MPPFFVYAIASAHARYESNDSVAYVPSPIMVPSQPMNHKAPFDTLEAASYCAGQLPKDMYCEKVLISILTPDKVIGKLRFDRNHPTKDYWYADSVEELRAYGVVL
ncbi:hypothetical protein CLV58_1438 [Spirosoma oryzae]|uniref:Uncharacterized protein n=1 Tax=Spirosoma oryzae TaxID=1469603 RepID=A0A2T0RP91_9BACT|nr:hypothetical protein CLV58_1438 [Spirosoma oryzae]